jgi:tol-pal system protein YbgF
MASAPIAANAGWWTNSLGAKPAVSETSQRPLFPVQFPEGVPERFNRIEAQMRTLTGQVEELTHELRQLQDQLTRMQEDNEFRFRDLEGAGSSGIRSEPAEQAAASESGGSPPQSVPILPPPGQPDAIGAIAGEPPTPPPAPRDVGGLAAPPQPLGTLTIDAPSSANSNQPIDLTQPLPPAGPQVAMIAPTGDPRTDYDRAYGSILSGDYDTAELALRQFLAAYPDNALAPDAQYWLGESLFVRAQYRDAANEFLAGFKAYPKSAKAPDALLKLGLSLAGLGEREAACRTFDAVLKQYPDASNALRQRVKFERSSASC